jgi:hypothetical protein
MNDHLSSHSAGWLFFVKASFVIALCAMLAGILFSPIEFIVKAYFGLCALFLVSSTITLAKSMRDQHESQRIMNKIAEAKTQQLIKEYAE